MENDYPHFFIKCWAILMLEQAFHIHVVFLDTVSQGLCILVEEGGSFLSCEPLRSRSLPRSSPKRALLLHPPLWAIESSVYAPLRAARDSGREPPILKTTTTPAANYLCAHKSEMPLELAHGPELKVIDGGSLPLTGDICLLEGFCIWFNNTSKRSSSADAAMETPGMADSQLFQRRKSTSSRPWVMQCAENTWKVLSTLSLHTCSLLGSPGQGMKWSR